jgi:two-component system phosphate regulon response regulator PhoB
MPAPHAKELPLGAGVSPSGVPQEVKAKKKETPAAGRAHLLVVEDELDLQELLRYNLARDGFRVTCVDSGEKAIIALRAETPDLIVLDVMLPGMDGLEFCRAVRGNPQTLGVPIVMLTAKSEESDVVAGLELGADDYVTKPFSPRVLLSRVKAVLRRGKAAVAEAQAGGEESESRIEVGDLVIRPERHEALVKGAPVELTATEFRLLHLLARRPGRVFTRQQIIEAIHGKMISVTDRSVDVQVVMLRRKLGEVGQEIQTVRGVGYRFRE